MTPEDLMRAADFLRSDAREYSQSSLFESKKAATLCLSLASKLDNEAADINALGTECARLKAELEEARKNESTLRRLLAIAHAGAALYHDDGELQDNRCLPFIDFKRDSGDEIEEKLAAQTYRAALASPRSLGPEDLSTQKGES